MIPLGIAPIGISCKIAKISADDKVKKHLENLGFIVGQSITPLSDNAGSVIIRIKEGKLALNSEIAMKVFVA